MNDFAPDVKAQKVEYFLNIQDFPCNQCPKWYSEGDNFKKHIRINIGANGALDTDEDHIIAKKVQH